jgi:osmotically-inducible protein OsmY
MRYLVAGALILSASCVGGCVPLIAGGAATGAVMASQDRGFEQGVNDNEIAVEINRKLAEKDAALFVNVTTQITKGRVVLIGTVKQPEDRIVATKVAWSVGGVKEVIDQLEVGKPLSFSEQTSDTVITTKLRAAIIGDNKVSSINYSIETLRGTIYLMGIAQNQAELDRVVGYARGISGVRNVVTNVEVKAPAAAQQ